VLAAQIHDPVLPVLPPDLSVFCRDGRA
jgi:hypothetical protein